MTKKQNKISCMYLPINCMELSKIYYYNGNRIKILDYLKLTSMPSDLQHAILSQDYSKVLKVIRKHKKNDNKNYKHVNITHTCKVYSYITDSWHDINGHVASGFYNDINTIKTLVNNHKIKNTSDNIKDLKYTYVFTVKEYKIA